MGYMNATARLSWPVSVVTADLVRVPAETTDTQEVRVSLRPMSRATEQSVLGALSVGAYIMHTPYTRGKEFLPAQRFEAKLDDEGQWRQYTVRQVKRQGRLWDLLVERV